MKIILEIHLTILETRIIIIHVMRNGGEKMNIIKAYRERTGMKQKELAAVVGVSTSAVAMWEIGKRFPRPQHIPTLARVLGCSIADLYGSEQKGA